MDIKQREDILSQIPEDMRAQFEKMMNEQIQKKVSDLVKEKTSKMEDDLQSMKNELSKTQEELKVAQTP